MAGTSKPRRTTAAAPWTDEQAREVLRRVLAEMDSEGHLSRMDLPTVLWGASTALTAMREVLDA